MDDIALSILREIMFRDIDGDLRPSQNELMTLRVIARSKRASFATKCFAQGALAWIEKRMYAPAGL